MLPYADPEKVYRSEFYGRFIASDGTETIITDDDIVSNSVTLTESCCNGSFGFGALIASQLDIAFILTDKKRYFMKGSSLKLYRRYYSSENELLSEIPLGVFFPDLSSVKLSKQTLKVTYFDNSMKLDKYVTDEAKEFKNEWNALQFLSYACAKCGIVLLEFEQTKEFPNAKETSEKYTWQHSESEKITYRQMACAALQLMGAFGRIDRYGRLEVHGLDNTTPKFTINADNAIKRTISDSEVEITGIKAGSTFKFGTEDGYLYELSSNLIVGDFEPPNTDTAWKYAKTLMEIRDSGKVTGLKTYSADITWFGNPAVEPGDCYIYEESRADTQSKRLVVHETIWKPHGACTIHTYAPDSERGMVNSSSSQSGVVSGNTVTNDLSYIKSILLGGMTITKISKDTYDKSEPKENTIYYVVENDGKITQYIGSIKVSGGDSGSNVPTLSSVLITATPAGTIGHIEKHSRIIDLTGLTWEQGSLNFGTDTEIDSNTRIRTAEHIPLDGSNVIDIAISATDTNGSNLMIDFTFYDADKKVIETIIWHDSGTQKTVPGNTKFLRILLKREGDIAITPDALNSCVMKETFL